MLTGCSEIAKTSMRCLMIDPLINLDMRHCHFTHKIQATRKNDENSQKQPMAIRTVHGSLNIQFSVKYFGNKDNRSVLADVQRANIQDFHVLINVHSNFPPVRSPGSEQRKAADSAGRQQNVNTTVVWTQPHHAHNTRLAKRIR